MGEGEVEVPGNVMVWMIEFILSVGNDRGSPMPQP